MKFVHDSPSTVELFFRYVETRPQQIFAKFGERTLTASQLRDLVQETSQHLRDLGIEPGDRVAYMLDNSIDLIVLVFSLMILGSVQIPINTRLRNESLEFIVTHSDSKLILAEDCYQSAIRSIVGGRPEIDLISRHSEQSFQRPRISLYGDFAKIEFPHLA